MVITGAQQVVEELARRRDELVTEVVAESQSVPGYSELPPVQAADFAETVREGLEVVVGAMATQRALGDRDLTFLWAHIRRRTQAGIAEGDMLAVVRIFQRVLWDTILDVAGDTDLGRSAALTLARPLLSYVDVLSHTVNAAFTEADEAIAMRAGSVRREALESLLAGALPAPGGALDAARRAGLDHDRPLAVISARPLNGELDDSALLVACVALARGAHGAGDPLAAVRDGEVIAAIAIGSGAGANDQLVPALRKARARLEQRGIALALGLSTVRHRLDELPAAYREACVAREQLRSGAMLAMCELSVADYLLLRSGDETAWRLIPEEVRRFVEEDAAAGCVLSDTLLAYVECDLNVRLAAERLFVHANTAHYRLARIEERTGCSLRRLADVLLIAIAIRLSRRT